MIYHPREHKITKITKFLAFWASMFIMAWLMVSIFHDDIKIPQREITLKIDLKNRVNICAPENNDLSLTLRQAQDDLKKFGSDLKISQ
jgi:hypothetical protein